MLRAIAPAAAAFCLTTAAATAYDLADRRLDSRMRGDVIAQVVPGTSYEVVVGASQLEAERGLPKRALVAAVAGWTAAETGLPAPAELPRIALVTPRAMQDLRYRKVGLPPPSEAGVVEDDVFAVYDDATRTIYLPTGWTGRSRAELSLLVHEMVHHLQNLAGRTFACVGEREKAAYAAQEGWLVLFGGDLRRDFGIDPMTRLVRTACLL